MAHWMPPRVAWLLRAVCSSVAIACGSGPDDPGANSDSSPDETEGCTAVPRGKLFPIIGAFMGPDPGPCSMNRSGLEFRFQYATDSTLTYESATDGTDNTAFSFDQGVLVTETRTWARGVSETTYEYMGERIRTITIDPDGTSTGYEYELDARGYVRTATLLNTVSSPSIPTRYTYEYVNCTLRWRVAYDPNEAVNLTETVNYAYDTQHRLTTRTSVTNEDEFDYSCW